MPANELKAKDSETNSRPERVEKHEAKKTKTKMKKTTLQDRDTETETMEIIEYLQKNEEEKDKQIEGLIVQLKIVKQEGDAGKEQMAVEFQRQLDELKEKLTQKSRELEFVRAELKLVRDFNRKQNAMKKELEETRALMAAANREYKENLVEIEEKFSNEKVKLQREASEKIAQLATEAHSEALTNLDVTTKSVYKDNVRLKKSLQFYVDQVEELKRWKRKTEKENAQLRSDRELDKALIHRKVTQSRHDRSLIKELQASVSVHEKALSLAVQEFESQKRSADERGREALESASSDIARLQKALQLKTRETNRVKTLARNILDQRTDVERFFLDALKLVREKIELQRVESETRLGDWSKDRRHFSESCLQKTIDVKRLPDRSRSEQILTMSSKVDISDLTWEQKEAVLRHLFGRMNKAAASRAAAAAAAAGPKRPPQGGGGGGGGGEGWYCRLPHQSPSTLTLAGNESKESIENALRYAEEEEEEEEEDNGRALENPTFLTEMESPNERGGGDRSGHVTTSLVEIPA